MRRILIISYFFPPCNLTASQRVYSWAKNLSKFGYKPVVVTRKWEAPIRTFLDCCIPTSDKEEHEDFGDFEVYRMPYLGNLRDRIYARFGPKKFAFLRKALTLKGLFLEPLLESEMPYQNLYLKSSHLLSSETFDGLIISGNPFMQFKFGYSLQREFGIPWVADYRDAWTTSEINFLGRNKIFRLLNLWERYFEKKWVSSASLVTSSSKPIGDSINALTGVNAHPIYNGFSRDDFLPFQNEKKSANFQIAYIGTLYAGQDISIFINAFKRFVDTYPDSKAELLFPGLRADEAQHQRVATLTRGYEDFVKISERIPRQEILRLEKRCHLLLHVAWKGFRGIVASKIYEYLGSGTPILVTPSDNGAIQDILTEARWGTITNTVEETYTFLENFYVRTIVAGKDDERPSAGALEGFTREHQAEKMASLLREHVRA